MEAARQVMEEMLRQELDRQSAYFARLQSLCTARQRNLQSLLKALEENTLKPTASVVSEMQWFLRRLASRRTDAIQFEESVAHSMWMIAFQILE